MRTIKKNSTFFCLVWILWSQPQGPNFFFEGSWGSASRAEFPVSLSNHVGFTPRLLYSSTHHSPESFTHLKTGWAQDAWLQCSFENWYFHLDISRWLSLNNLVSFMLWMLCLQQHSSLPRRFDQSGNWLSSRCLTSVITQELVFPSSHQRLTLTELKQISHSLTFKLKSSLHPHGHSGKKEKNRGH